jgi:hypothetical protein
LSKEDIIAEHQADGEEDIDEDAINDITYREQGREKALYFFNTITGDLLPDWSENIIESQNEKIINLYNSPKKSEE